MADAGMISANSTTDTMLAKARFNIFLFFMTPFVRRFQHTLLS